MALPLIFTSLSKRYVRVGSSLYPELPPYCLRPATARIDYTRLLMAPPAINFQSTTGVHFANANEIWTETWMYMYDTYTKGIANMRDKRNKFVELAEARVNRAIKDVRLIGNLANKSAYDYSEDDVRKVFRALQKELDAAKARFTGDAGGKDNEFRLE